MGFAAWATCPGAANGQSFVATVKNLEDQEQRIVVALDRSVMVETSVEVARADVVAGHIVDVQPVSPKQLLITGKAYGTTQVILWSPDEKKWALNVQVELDLSALAGTIAEIDPRAEVQARSVLGNIVLTGTVSSAETAQRIVEVSSLFLPVGTPGRGGTAVQNHMRVAGEQQVLLRCTVAEVNRVAVRQLGINGFLAGDDFRDAFVVNQIGGINPINIGAAANTDATSTIPFMTGTEGIPISPTSTLSLGFPRVQMQVFLKAMADNSLLKILAEPNLVCISGETATFLAGGEFPIPVPQDFQTVTIDFREFGVRLNFTPVVEAHQRIRLRVNPEVSETDFSTSVQVAGFVVPGLTQRSAETTVNVGNGQTIAIAGLLSDQVLAVASRLPGIGDLPVLGALFRSVEYRKEQTELVILVTPEIVAPMEADQHPGLPTDGMLDPTDFEFYALGRIEGEPRERTAASPVVSKGSPQVRVHEPPDSLAIRGPWGYSLSSATP